MWNFRIQHTCTVVSDGVFFFIRKGTADGEDAGCCLCAAGFPPSLQFGRRSMTVWMCADMLMVLLHQWFGKGEVKATPASCFQRGVLCVYPQATIKASREPRFNHMHHSCPTETHCSKPETRCYQKSGTQLYCLITKSIDVGEREGGGIWPDCDLRNYSLCEGL